MELKKTLATLVNESGVSGSEMNVSKIIQNLFIKHCDDVKVDLLGNIVALKKGNKKNGKNIKVMLAAHMDEIGLMVKKIDENGFILFTNVGGVDYRTLLSQEVIIHGEKDIFGVIGAKPPHLQKESEKDQSIKMEDLYIDVGFTKKEVDKWLKVGDFISINRKLTSLHRDSIAGKAIDDRAGIVALLHCMKELENFNHQADIFFTATVQEEVGLRGAITSTYGIMPDIGIAIDVGHGTTPGVTAEDSIELGKGPAIGIGPNIHPAIDKKFIELAKEYKVPYQIEILPGGSGTDAWAIQVTKSGVPTGLLSIPLKYMHTSVELGNMEDIKLSGRLLALFIMSLNDVDMEEWLCY